MTSIQFLSLSNKTIPAGRNQYRTKQQTMLDAAVNLVEVDLLRSGSWMVAVPKGNLGRASLQPYRACVVRATKKRVAEVYPISLREPLPTIRIPLRSDDNDVVLNLQSLLDTTYANGGYEDINYAEDAHPPLTGPDAEWADQLLRQKGLR